MKKTLPGLILFLFAIALPVTLVADQSRVHPLDSVYQESLGADSLELAKPHTRLRRLSLQIRGQGPDLQELEEIQPGSYEHPQDLIQAKAGEYLKSREYAEYWGLYFSELFREDTDLRSGKYGSYYKYLAEALHKNMAYKDLVRDLILSRGSVGENGAANFYLRDDGDPLMVAEYVSRVFYGRRYSCARCHDHPYEKTFTRRHYYGIAAFFSQVWVQKRHDYEFLPRERIEHFPEPEKNAYNKKRSAWYRDTWNKIPKNQRKAFQKKHELQYANVLIEKDLAMRFPYSDDQPGGDLIAPRFPDGTKPEIKPGQDRRKVFVDWLTAKENKRYRWVILNRIWGRMMGWHFFEPLDDLTANTEIRGKEVLEHLDERFLEKDTRIKDIIYYIATSKSYGRRGPRPGEQDDPVALFPPQRLNPAQLFNSMLVASGQEEMSRMSLRVQSSGKDPFYGIGQIRSPQKGSKQYSCAAQAPRPARYGSFFRVFGEGDREDIDEYDPSVNIDMILAMINGRTSSELSWKYGGDGSELKKRFGQHKDLEKTIDEVYLSFLGRKPTEKEQDAILKLAGGRYSRSKDGFQQDFLSDLVWALINSEEFLHVH